MSNYRRLTDEERAEQKRIMREIWEKYHGAQARKQQQDDDAQRLKQQQAGDAVRLKKQQVDDALAQIAKERQAQTQ